MSLRQLVSVARRGGWQAARATAPRSVPVVTRWTPTLVRPVAPVLTRSFGAQSFLDDKEVADRVLSVVKNFEKVEASKVTATARFKEDLSLDSLDVVEVVMAIEEEFALEIPDAEADKILSIDDAIKYIASHPQAK